MPFTSLPQSTHTHTNTQIYVYTTLIYSTLSIMLARSFPFVYFPCMIGICSRLMTKVGNKVIEHRVLEQNSQCSNRNLSCLVLIYIWESFNLSCLVQGWAMKREIFKRLKKKINTWIFICLFVINEKLMNSTFVLCQFEILCFEINALMMASVSTHAFLKSGPETVHDLSQYIHRNCSHFILNSLF